MHKIFLKLVLNGEKVFFIRMSCKLMDTYFNVKYSFTYLSDSDEKKSRNEYHQIRNAVDILNTIFYDLTNLYELEPMLNIGIGYNDKFFYYVVADLYKPQAFNFCGSIMATMITARNSALIVYPSVKKTRNSTFVVV